MFNVHVQLLASICVSCFPRHWASEVEPSLLLLSSNVHSRMLLLRLLLLSKPVALHAVRSRVFKGLRSNVWLTQRINGAAAAAVGLASRLASSSTPVAHTSCAPPFAEHDSPERQSCRCVNKELHYFSVKGMHVSPALWYEETNIVTLCARRKDTGTHRSPDITAISCAA